MNYIRYEVHEMPCKLSTQKVIKFTNSNVSIEQKDKWKLWTESKHLTRNRFQVDGWRITAKPTDLSEEIERQKKEKCVSLNSVINFETFLGLITWRFLGFQTLFLVAKLTGN